MSDDDDMVPGDTDDVVVEGAFGSQLAREAALVGAERARAEAAEQRAWALERVAVASEIIGAYDNEWLNDPKKFSKLFKSAAAKLALDLLRGATPVQNASQAAAAMTALMNAGRLEAGEHTSFGATVDGDEQMEAIKRMRDEANRRIAEAEKARGAQVTSLDVG